MTLPIFWAVWNISIQQSQIVYKREVSICKDKHN